ncbi:MAG: DUF445 family protein [Candidatus Izimaplasma sp.]|nr:DUF445 family protein [Candidatus Izimaplasma bacterium]
MTEIMIRLITLIVIGGLIGYFTNKLAIKMLFRPVNPIRFLGLTIQGVFPKRKDKMAKSLAEIIERDLLTKDVLAEELLKDDNIDNLKEKIKDHFIDTFSDSIPPMVKMFLGENPKAKIAEMVEKRGDAMLNQLIDILKEEGFNNIDIYDIVKRKIDELDFIEFEQIIFGLMKKELKFVEVVGLFLGAMIGALQFVVTILLPYVV